MSPPVRHHPTIEGRSGSRIDLEEAGAIWVSPEIALSERSRVSREPGAVHIFQEDIGAPRVAEYGVPGTGIGQSMIPT